MSIHHFPFVVHVTFSGDMLGFPGQDVASIPAGFMTAGDANAYAKAKVRESEGDEGLTTRVHVEHYGGFSDAPLVDVALAARRAAMSEVDAFIAEAVED